MPNARLVESSPVGPPAANPFAVFFALADRWKLNTDQQIVLLGNPARSTFFKWKKDSGLMSADTEERISHLLSIFKALEILFPVADRADEWIRRPNQFFEGRTALEVMLGGKLADIIRVRTYLDAQRGG
ncbi:MAG: MbcA/ParS/Xre antitoxin family protein [Phenylobacterium sp.]|nr:MbcA/ParS/Xre antitoxin family protein [Phenylobacterium sp.]